MCVSRGFGSKGADHVEVDAYLLSDLGMGIAWSSGQHYVCSHVTRLSR